MMAKQSIHEVIGSLADREEKVSEGKKIESTLFWDPVSHCLRDRISSDSQAKGKEKDWLLPVSQYCYPRPRNLSLSVSERTEFSLCLTLCAPD